MIGVIVHNCEVVVWLDLCIIDYLCVKHNMFINLLLLFSSPCYDCAR